jgi:hypothetical protein
MQQKLDIFQFYSGAEQMDVHGMDGLLTVQMRMGIYQFYSGAVQMDALVVVVGSW